MRFGFEFDDNNVGFDFKDYAENIDYGFVYTYDSYEGKSDFQKNIALRANKSNVKVKTALKRNVDGTVSTYNAVFTGIPKDYSDDGISVRSYICVDGMYFYSLVATYNLSDIKNYSDDDSADNDIKFDHIHEFVKTVYGPYCEKNGYTQYRCTGCNKTYSQDFTDPVGHGYHYTDFDNSLLNYQCIYCGKTLSKSNSNLPEFKKYINTQVKRGDDNMYLDLNNDRYVNAKDFALIKKNK